MTVLLGYKAPDGIQALVIWLSAVGETRANRPPGAVLPFYMVTRPTVSDDQIVQTGTYRVHSYACAVGNVSALTGAYDAAVLAESRVLALAPRFGPQQPVTVDGRIIFSDGVSTLLGPTWSPRYTDDGSIEHFVADYEIKWRFIAA